MESMDQAIDHSALEEILKSCGSSWNAGQVHGLLCSRLAVTGADGAARWFAQVLEDTDPQSAERSKCEAVAGFAVCKNLASACRTAIRVHPAVAG